MASYTVTYACGHSATRQLYGKVAERERYLAWAGSSGTCDTCRAKGAEARREAIEAEHALPPLAGTDKQVAWARTIRADKIEAVAQFMAGKRPATMTADQAAAFDEQAAAVMQTLYSETAARWWIDHRDRHAQEIAMQAYKETRQ